MLGGNKADVLCRGFTNTWRILEFLDALQTTVMSKKFREWILDFLCNYKGNPESTPGTFYSSRYQLSQNTMVRVAHVPGAAGAEISQKTLVLSVAESGLYLSGSEYLLGFGELSTRR